MLLGLVRPSAGSATINGRPYREVRNSVGASLEAVGFHPGRTGRGHLRARALARGADGARHMLCDARASLAISCVLAVTLGYGCERFDCCG
jgi:ABC-type multidrug transport system ATPase subunit